MILNYCSSVCSVWSNHRPTGSLYKLMASHDDVIVWWGFQWIEQICLVHRAIWSRLSILFLSYYKLKAIYQLEKHDDWSPNSHCTNSQVEKSVVAMVVAECVLPILIRSIWSVMWPKWTFQVEKKCGQYGYGHICLWPILIWLIWQIIEAKLWQKCGWYGCGRICLWTILISSIWSVVRPKWTF